MKKTIISTLALVCSIGCTGPLEAPAQSQPGSRLSVSIVVADDQGDSYCAVVQLQNTGAVPTTAWTLVVDIGLTELSAVWGGDPSVNGSALTVRGLGADAIIPPSTSHEVWICGATSNPEHLDRPRVLSVVVS